ncbi:hypothetical protein KKC1_30420, partial [Calderihabitans maritimus]
MARVT